MPCRLLSPFGIWRTLGFRAVRHLAPFGIRRRSAFGAVRHFAFCSWHWHSVRRRVPARHEVLELPLDVSEQRAGAEAEQVGAEPAVAELLLHQIEVLQCRLGRADPTGRLEADAD